MTSALLTCLLGVALALHLYHFVRKSRAAAAKAFAKDMAVVKAVVADAAGIPTGTAGVSAWAGTWHGERVQVKTIVDTLAVRKLPALWLVVTITEKTRIAAVFDMMMRPGAATTFSNFEHLPYTLPTPSSFPEGAVIRGDQSDPCLPAALAIGHLDLFADARAKELLITPNGVRIVWLLAEADRARYGVFRQAAFSGSGLEPGLLEELIRRASALRAALDAEARLQAA